MVDQNIEAEPFRQISRFSTSTSLGMATAAESSMHVVPMPRWSTPVGCARVILAVLVLAFAAAATAIWGGYGAFGFALFTASASLIIFTYYFVALSHQPALYNRWAILSLEIFGVVFWLVSFALLANWTSVYDGGDYWYGDGDAYGFWHAPYSPSDIGLRKRYMVKRGTNKYHDGVALAGTAAGLGAVEFVLYSVTLVVFGMSLHKQRMEARCTVNGPQTTNPVSAPETDKAEEATEPMTETEPATV